MLFFKHLYLICNIFYNTLYYSYVLHSTTFYALVSDQTEEKKKPSITPVSLPYLAITDWVLSLPRSDSNGCPDFL